ncbi:MAG: tetratricopeptide repeat protein [Candidatus Zixiibacteriota bacterium]
MKRLLLTTMFLLMAGNVMADGDGGTESPFALGAGARDLALGGTALADGDATTAPYWNASRLAEAEFLSLTAFHTRLFVSDVTYQYFGLVVPTMDFGGFGLGVFRLGVDDIERRDETNLLLDTFDDNRLGLYLAYARNISGYNAGVAVSLETHSLDTYSATSSPGLDISIGRRFALDYGSLSGLSFNLVGRNLIKPSIELANESVTYPRSFDFSLATKLLPGAAWDHSLSLSSSLSMVEALDATIAMGLEYNLRDMLFLRGGYRDDRLSFGVGLAYSFVNFDYALVDRDMGTLHMFNLTTSFGKSVAEKRQIKAMEREREFNQLMTERLSSQNQEMIADLTKQGNDLLAVGDYRQAAEYFDRALFMMKGNGVDTTDMYTLAVETHARADELDRRILFEQSLDSAMARFESEDYLAAKYLANQALTVIEDSPEALALLNRADSAIAQTRSREQVIEQQLLLIDSLIAYGEIDLALSNIAPLVEMAPDDRSVRLADKKVRFEALRRDATTAYERSNLSVALTRVEAALKLFPDHQWCLDMRNRITRQMTKTQTLPRVVQTSGPQPLSDRQRRDVERDYQDGQSLFAGGNLSQAIQKWETVYTLAPEYKSVRDYLVKAYKFMGVELYGQDKLRDAITVWQRAAVLSPDDAEIRQYIERTQSEIEKLMELSYENR